MRLTAHSLDTMPPASSSPTFLHGQWRFPLLVVALGEVKYQIADSTEIFKAATASGGDLVECFVDDE